MDVDSASFAEIRQVSKGQPVPEPHRYSLDPETGVVRLGGRSCKFNRQQLEMLRRLYAKRGAKASGDAIASEMPEQPYNAENVANLAKRVRERVKAVFTGGPLFLLSQGKEGYWLNCEWEDDATAGDQESAGSDTRNDGKLDWQAACAKMLADGSLRRAVTDDGAELRFRVRLPLARISPGEGPEFIDVPTAVAPQQARLAIVGVSGYGKTTALEDMAAAALEDPAGLAFVVPARDVGENGILEYLACNWFPRAFPGSSSDPRPELVAALAGGAWVFLDGLDEAGPGAIARLASWLRRPPALARLAVSCSWQVWASERSALPQFETYQLAPGDAHSAAFVEEWLFHSRSRAGDQGGRASRVAATGVNLSWWPSLVAPLCETVDRSAGPISRGAVFAVVAAAACRRRLADLGLPSDPGPMLAALARLARGILDRGTGDAVGRDLAQVELGSGDPCLGAEYLRHAIELEWVETAGVGLVRFRDAQLLTYFAASSIVDWQVELLPPPLSVGAWGQTMPADQRHRAFEPGWDLAAAVWASLAVAPERDAFLAALLAFQDGIVGTYDDFASLLAGLALRDLPGLTGAEAVFERLIELHLAGNNGDLVFLFQGAGPCAGSVVRGALERRSSADGAGSRAVAELRRLERAIAGDDLLAEHGSRVTEPTEVPPLLPEWRGLPGTTVLRGACGQLARLLGEHDRTERGAELEAKAQLIHREIFRHFSYPLVWLAWRHPLTDPPAVPSQSPGIAVTRERIAQELRLRSCGGLSFVVEARRLGDETALDVLDQLAAQNPEITGASGDIPESLTFGQLARVWNRFGRGGAPGGRTLYLVLLEGPGEEDVFDHAVLSEFSRFDDGRRHSILLVGRLQRGLGLPAGVAFLPDNPFPLPTAIVSVLAEQAARAQS